MFRHVIQSLSTAKRSGPEPKSPSKTHHRNRYLPILEGVSILIALGLWHWGQWQSLENLAYNALYQSRQAVLPHQGWDDRLVVIAIDNATLATLNQFPLPRSYYAELLQTLNFSLPAVVGFDILFSESTPDDDEFAGAIADSWNVVLAISDGLGGSSMELVPELSSSAAATGHVHASPDSDGTTRKIDLYKENLLYQENLADRQFVPTLAIATLQIYAESLAATAGEAVPEFSNPSSLWESIVESSVQSPGVATLQPQLAAMDSIAWVNWPAPVAAEGSDSSCTSKPQPGELQVYSMVCVLDQQVSSEVFANKIILVGMTAQGLDPLVTPFNQNPPTSGVFSHAALIDNLLNDRLLQRPPRWAEGLLIALLGLGVTIAMRRLNLIGRGVILIGLPLLWFIGSVGALQVNWWLPVAAPIGTVMLVLTGTQIREQLEKQQLMNLFEIYVSPKTARHIWKHKQDVLTKHQSEIEELVATILFVDIRRFTSISEELPPDQLMAWLNRYLDTMTTCILEHGGQVDKYIGDEIMAVFSSPQQTPSTATEATDRQNAQGAIAASLAMHEGLRHLNREFISEGLPTVQFGIGIHTGTVVAGNLGGPRRYNYSIVGDTVNVASRLQGLNKQITDNNPFHVLMSSTTYDHVGDRYPGHPVGQLKLRGREQELLVYSLQEVHEFKAL